VPLAYDHRAYAEAMTVFAKRCRLPFIHLGRVWVVYWILPYPNQRNLWPNLQSPLLFDVIAVSTYLTVSSLFWYTGLIPDLAVVRDRATGLRRKIYGVLSLGWVGTHLQWNHYGMAYLLFAALATPLVISVHSVVSWDFALSTVPGWHSTIFAPYFVAGAIHSGLAMVIAARSAAAHFQDPKPDHRKHPGEPGQNHCLYRPHRGLFIRHRVLHRLVQRQHDRADIFLWRAIHYAFGS
jgi:Ni/Fe-hydrogenase subunit HybB-like protein